MEGMAGRRTDLYQTMVDNLVTQAQYNQWQTELSNWGRWGPDDELGAANLITPTKRAEAAAQKRKEDREPQLAE